MARTPKRGFLSLLWLIGRVDAVVNAVNAVCASNGPPIQIHDLS